ncbi:hypothetical protein Btru_032142 [Bulinus truncatus]|nr:hypothetical protein Btru_032142 [Bulinus truncatus]
MTRVTVAPTPSHGVDNLTRKLHAQQKQPQKTQPIRKPQQLDLKPDDYEEQDDEEEDSKDKSEETNISKEQPYVKSQSIDKSLQPYVKSQSIDKSLQPYVKSQSIDKSLQPYAKSQSIDKSLQPYVKSQSIDKSFLPVRNQPTPSSMKPLDHAKVKPEKKMAKNFKPSQFQSTASALGSLKKPKSTADDVDPNYAMWLPPPEQAGDGRTNLNDKLGY